MVRHHIPQRTCVFIVAAPVLDPQTLGNGDLNVVDILAVPYRLKNAVGESQYQDILDRLLAQIVIDSIDLVFFQHPLQFVVESPSRFQIMPERFFDDDAAPRAIPFDR